MSSENSEVVVLYSLDQAWPKRKFKATVAHAVKVRQSLEQAGIQARLVAVINDVFKSIAHIDPSEIVFNLVRSLGGVTNGDVLTTTVLEESGLSHTGSDYVCLDQCRDKFHFNSMCQAVGIRVPEATLVLDDDQELSGVRLPAIVKPNHGDEYLGISVDSVVYTPEELRSQVRRVWQEHGQPPVVETYIDGRELSVSIIGNAPRRILPILEISFDGLPPGIPRILGTSCQCPTKLSLPLLREVELLAVRSAQIGGCRDYAQVEFRVDGSGVPYVIEINPNPDISPGSAFARSLDAAGISLEDMASQIIEWTRIRAKAERADQLKAGSGA